jgi:hypothetical protein
MTEAAVRRLTPLRGDPNERSPAPAHIIAVFGEDFQAANPEPAGAQAGVTNGSVRALPR